MKRTILFLLLVAPVFYSTTQAQSVTGSNVVTTALPFLSIAPDSRGGAIGDAGVATTPDINAQHWNPAKYVFVESKSGVALSYTPWLRSLVSDMNLAYLVGYTKLDDISTVSGSLRYFDLGSITFYTDTGAEMETVSPNEFALDFGYSRKLSDEWSGSVAMRYMRSDLFSGTENLSPGNSFGADVSFYYLKKFRRSQKESTMSYGINVSNIGNKISYDKGTTKDFIPTNLRLGGSYSTEIDNYNQFFVTLDFNKLLVPTILNKDNIEDYQAGKLENIRGLGNDDVGPIEGIFVSFADAPNGFKEELQEITMSVGAEYWYAKQFAVRAGYFHEPENKGDRKFLTFGAGLKMNVFSLDFSYIYTLSRKSPLENTLRFTLGFDLDDFQSQGKRRR
jgi:hypothetical protein